MGGRALCGVLSGHGKHPVRGCDVPLSRAESARGLLDHFAEELIRPVDADRGWGKKWEQVTNTVVLHQFRSPTANTTGRFRDFAVYSILSLVRHLAFPSAGSTSHWIGSTDATISA